MERRVESLELNVKNIVIEDPDLYIYYYYNNYLLIIHVLFIFWRAKTYRIGPFRWKLNLNNFSNLNFRHFLDDPSMQLLNGIILIFFINKYFYRTWPTKEISLHLYSIKFCDIFLEKWYVPNLHGPDSQYRALSDLMKVSFWFHCTVPPVIRVIDEQRLCLIIVFK